MWTNCGQKNLLAIDTPAKRQRLPARANPYWVAVGGGRGGVSLGYRRRARGAGSWVAKVVLLGQRLEERLGKADDSGADGDVIAYPVAVASALAWSERQAEVMIVQQARPARTPPTVQSAVESYIATRIARSAEAGTNAAVRLKLHVVGDQVFATIPLRKLRAGDIEAWRARLPTKQNDSGRRPLAPSTINRLLNDVRAALNAAAEAHRREFSPHLPAEIKAGTKALSVASNARKQILDAAAVKAIVRAAEQVDADFGAVILLAAASGARFSQLAAITVGDLQAARRRVLVPSSRKGRAARAKPPIPVPLSDGVLARLEVAADGRPVGEPLLMRWAYRHVGGLRWEKDHRRAWDRPTRSTSIGPRRPRRQASLLTP